MAVAVEDRQILESLRQGTPLPSELAAQILSPSFADAIVGPIKAVRRVRGVGRAGVREFYWLTGRPGSGKTQALTEFIKQLPQLEGDGKYALATLRVDQEIEAATSGALPYGIVRHALGGQALPEVSKVAANLLRGSEVESTVRESVVFGVDVIAGAAGLPAASLFADKGLRKVISWVKATGPYVRSKLRGRWDGQPEALELLVEWVRYVLRPSIESRSRFEQHLLRLSTTGELFGLFCNLLESANYTTLVVVLDEVTPSSLRGVKALWDRPLGDSGGRDYFLNLIVLLAAPDQIREDAARDAVLARRICATPNGHITLPGAVVGAAEADDDFAHAVRVVSDILKKAAYLQRKDGRSGLAQLRLEMSQSSPITWQTLWRGVIDQLAVLS
jgi:hypothetical protein